MAEQVLGSIFSPELRDVLDTHKADIMRSMNCIQVGTVQAFNPLANTVSVSLNFKRELPDGRVFEYPLLTDVPVFIYAGGYSHFVMPIETGDSCIVLFCDKDIDLWHYSGETKVPNTARSHSLSDGIALVGIRPASNPHDITPGVVELTCGSTLDPKQLQITAFDGVVMGTGASATHVRLTTTVATLEAPAAAGSKVTASAAQASIAGPTATGAVVAAGSKVSVKNSAGSLFTQLDGILTQLITVCSAVPPVGAPLASAAATALGLIKTQLALIMEA